MSALYVPVRRAIYTTLGVVNKLLLPKSPFVFILCYHSIVHDTWDFSIDPEMFARQMNYLSKHFDFISMSDVADFIQRKKNIQRPSVAITFDDGYKDVMSIRAVVRSLKIHPMMSLIADTKNTNYKELATKRPFLTDDDVHTLAKDGWEFGSHTMTHPDLKLLTEKQIKDEVIGSKKLLEKRLSMKIPYFVYPKGRYTEAVLQAVGNAGYKLALTMDDTELAPGKNPLAVPRIGVDRTHSFGEFKVLYNPLVIAFRNFIKHIK